MQNSLAQDLAMLRDEFASAAQTIYDEWDQSDPDNDELNGGGICHLIADQIGSVAQARIPGAWSTTFTYEIGENHTVCVVLREYPEQEQADDEEESDVNSQGGEACIVDIPPWHYETGAAYTWHKLPNVRFDGSMVVIEPVDYSDFAGDSDFF